MLVQNGLRFRMNEAPVSERRIASRWFGHVVHFVWSARRKECERLKLSQYRQIQVAEFPCLMASSPVMWAKMVYSVTELMEQVIENRMDCDTVTKLCSCNSGVSICIFS